MRHARKFFGTWTFDRKPRSRYCFAGFGRHYPGRGHVAVGPITLRTGSNLQNSLLHPVGQISSRSFKFILVEQTLASQPFAELCTMHDCGIGSHAHHLTP